MTRLMMAAHVFGRGKSLSLFVLALVGALQSTPVRADDLHAPSDSDAKAYVTNCASCHGETLGGGFGPALKGDAFNAKWHELGRAGLRAFIAQKMPPTDPGGLAPAVYDQVANYLAQLNHLPNGGTENAGNAPAQNGRPPESPRSEAEFMNAMNALMLKTQSSDADYRAAGVVHQAILDRITPVSDALLRNPSPDDWLNWRRTDDGLGYSPLHQIDRHNAASLTVAWSLSLPKGTNEITPLVHDGVMFVDSAGTVQAIDIPSGDVLWTYAPPPRRPTMAPVTQPRNLALDGDRLIVATVDDHMIALNVHTGAVLWDHTIVADATAVWINGGPIVVHDKIIQGISAPMLPGGPFIVALDAKTGNEAWRFNTVAAPGTPDGDTWNGAPLSQRSGGSAWGGATYDPQSNLVFLGTGQSYHIQPLLAGDATRRRANSALYTDSTLALDPDTGKLVWYYQHMARETWDLDWTFERTIATLPIDGHDRRVVMTMGKIGILDVLDARTGQYLFSYDAGLQNLVTAIDPKTGWKTTDPAYEPEPNKPKHFCPSPIGVHSWPPSSYDPTTHLLYFPLSDSCNESNYLPGQVPGDITYLPKPRPNGDGKYGIAEAIDLSTRTVRWAVRHRADEASGMLTTAGGVVFEGGRDRYFRASDSATGKILWQIRLDNTPSAVPITFAAHGTQYVAITTGGGGGKDATEAPLTPEIESARPATTLWVFKLAESPSGPAN